MKVETYVIGIVSVNCYLVSNEETKECFLVDPGAYDEAIVDHIKKDGLKMQAILLTHGHFDHIMGIDGFLREFPVPVYACGEEEALLNDITLNVSKRVCDGYTFSGAAYLKDGEKLNLIGEEITMFHTPGHTAGGCCYYIPAEGVLFAGDTLFRRSVGRSDFPTGDGEALVQSIREKLLCLPDETKVFPGHMGVTTIGEEREYNPFCKK